MKNKRTNTVAKALISQVLSRHGMPLEIHTDQGRNFESRLFLELTTLLGIKKTRTTPLHPQSDGQVERQHRTILDYLAKFISENQRDWDQWIPWYLLAFRSSKHEATGATPAEVYLGQDLRLPLDLLRGFSPSDDVQEEGDYIQRLRGKLDKIHQLTRNRLLLRSRNAKSWYDRRARQFTLKEGQRVWFYNPQRTKGKAPKLQSPWEGPWSIIKKMSDVVYCIGRSGRRNKVVHMDRLAPFRERCSN